MKNINPFQFGNPVSGEYYLDRPDLYNAIHIFTGAHIPVVLIGPRRFGKTSFILNFLEKQDITETYLFMDIFNITSHKDFLQQVLRAIQKKASWGHKLKEVINSIPRLRPKIQYDVDPDTQQSSFSLSLDVNDGKDIKNTIQDILECLATLDDEVIVAIDEFQKITEINDNGWLEATLRTHMQKMKNNVSFIFTGSRQSVISDMLNNQSRPFYRSVQQVDFPPFEEEFTNWIIERFNTINVCCERKAIERLRLEVQNTPNYVQMVCFHMAATGVEKVDIKTMLKALEIVVNQNSYAYQTLLNSLTPAQQRVLRLCAIEQEQIFSKDTLKKYEIKSSAYLSSTLTALKERQILDEGTSRGKVIFDDPLFSIWLRYQFKEL